MLPPIVIVNQIDARGFRGSDVTSSGIENMCSSEHAGVQTDNYFGGVSKDLTWCNRGGKSTLTVSQTTSHATSK